MNKIGIGGQYDCADTQASVTDADGNTYVVGNYYRKITFGGVTYTGPNFLYGNYYVAKYDGEGTLAWVNWFNGSSNTNELEIDAIHVDPAGRVYVSGSFSRYLSFGNGVGLSISSSGSSFPPRSGFVVQYNNNGIPS